MTKGISTFLCKFGNCRCIAEDDDFFCKEHKEYLAISKPDKKKRKCLDCGKQFTSKHKGNRVCDSCKSEVRWNSGDITVHGTHPGSISKVPK